MTWGITLNLAPLRRGVTSLVLFILMGCEPYFSRFHYWKQLYYNNFFFEIMKTVLLFFYVAFHFSVSLDGEFGLNF